eukprot:10470435-Alexandrium_andersonii.AAC.1
MQELHLVDQRLVAHGPLGRLALRRVGGVTLASLPQQLVVHPDTAPIGSHRLHHYQALGLRLLVMDEDAPD